MIVFVENGEHSLQPALKNAHSIEFVDKLDREKTFGEHLGLDFDKSYAYVIMADPLMDILVGPMDSETYQEKIAEIGKTGFVNFTGFPAFYINSYGDFTVNL